jgi:RND superfamily putative drug exporter
MARFTRWILDHSRLVGVVWLIVVVASLASISSANNALSQSWSLPGKPGYETDQSIRHRYRTGGASPLVPVITLPAGISVQTPAVQAKLRGVFDRVQQAVPHARIASYASTGNPAFVSSDGRTTFALIFLPIDPKTGRADAGQDSVQSVLAGATVDGVHFHVTGFELLASGGSSGGNSALVETLIGLIGALLVLAVVFGSALAALPLAMALVTIPATFLLVWGLTRVTGISSIVTYLISLIGLGIAIDYSLLIVMRWREERGSGIENRAAVQRAMETAGTSVLFSGTTVGIGMLALVAIPVPAIRSIGYGGLLIPLVSVLAATTLLPAMLATIGPRIDWPARKQRGMSRFWTAWARILVKRRWIAAGLATIALAALALPALSLTAGDPKADSLSQTGEAHAGLVALEQSGIGPGALEPFEVLVDGTSARTVAERLATVQGIRGVVAPTGPQWNRGATSLLSAIPAADGASADGRATLTRVRHAAGDLPGSVRIGGQAAENADFLSAVYDNFPMMIAILSVLTFLLLARAFRSILLPLKAVALVLVSVAASCGFMTLVWQDGYGSQLLWGIPATGSVTAFIPLMVFAFLFGISMDYEVFLLSRMREEYDATGSTNAAIVRGIGSTGRLVTSAALILFLAFAALASGPEVDIKIIASGLAAGVVLDATIIRMLLVPALVALLGRWNWWLPAPMASVLRVRQARAVETSDDELLERIA